MKETTWRRSDIEPAICAFCPVSPTRERNSPVSDARPGPHASHVLGPPAVGHNHLGGRSGKNKQLKRVKKKRAVPFIVRSEGHSSHTWWGYSSALVELTGHSSRLFDGGAGGISSIVN
jgi:hypothetical protein